MPQSSNNGTRNRIINETIAVAAEVGWANVRLRIVAERLGMSLADIHAHFRDLDAVANAWFARSCEAMLAPSPASFPSVPARERVHAVMMRWFEAMEPHKHTVGQVLRTKMYPSHPHHWIPLVFDLSRLIHWVREAALLDAKGARRQMEEVGLTLVFLRTLPVWLCDRSTDQVRARQFLSRRLGCGDRIMRCVWGRHAPPAATADGVA